MKFSWKQYTSVAKSSRHCDCQCLLPSNPAYVDGLTNANAWESAWPMFVLPPATTLLSLQLNFLPTTSTRSTYTHRTFTPVHCQPARHRPSTRSTNRLIDLALDRDDRHISLSTRCVKLWPCQLESQSIFYCTLTNSTSCGNRQTTATVCVPVLLLLLFSSPRHAYVWLDCKLRRMRIMAEHTLLQLLLTLQEVRCRTLILSMSTTRNTCSCLAIAILLTKYTHITHSYTQP